MDDERERLTERPQQDSPFAIWHWSAAQLALFAVSLALIGWTAFFILFSVAWM